MKRRPFLALVAGSATTTAGGCLGGNVIQEIRESERIAPLGGEAWKIHAVGGSAEFSYTVKSEVHTFQVFYFRSRQLLNTYQSYLAGNEVETQSRGDERLAMVAVPDDDGIFTAKRPAEGGRMTIDIEEDHYLVVDYSNYDQSLHVDRYSDDLHVFVDVTIVEDTLI